MRHWIILAPVGSAIAVLQGCNHSDTSHGSHGVQAQQDAHSRSPHEPNQIARSRPTNQVAVLTVWAEAKRLEPTAKFYEDVLGLRRVGSSADPYILHGP